MKNMKMFTWIPGYCVTVIWLLHQNCAAQTSVTVVTDKGTFRGMNAFDSFSGVVSTFLGIPYAKPPERFKRAEPIEDSLATFDATSYSKRCWQKDADTNFDTGITSQNDEDCLYLNIYAPDVTRLEINDRYPVLFFIHNGALSEGPFQGGSSEEWMYRASGLAGSMGLVVVTINYRLGPFGFLSSEDSQSPGNFGLLDQVEALKWVKDNIAPFGGDPNNVVIFGGMSVSFHMLSSLSAGLFHKAVSMSGSALSPYAFVKKPLAILNIFSEELDCGSTEDRRTDTSDVINCLKGKSARDLADAAFRIPGGNGTAWAATRDGYFLDDDPLELMENDNFHRGIPYVIGVTEDEGYTFLERFIDDPNGMTEDEFRSTFIPNVLRRTEYNDYSNVLAPIIENEYRENNLDENNDIPTVKQSATDLVSDVFFKYPYEKELRLRAAAGLSSYAYVFQHSPANPSYGDDVVIHGSDVWYAMGIPNSDDTLPFVTFDTDNRDDYISNIMTAILASLAENGEPSGNVLKWDEYSSTRPNYQLISTSGINAESENAYQSSKMNFWDNFVPTVVNVVSTTEGPTQVAGFYSILFWIVLALFIIVVIAFVVFFLCCRNKGEKTQQTKVKHADNDSNRYSNASSNNGRVDYI